MIFERLALAFIALRAIVCLLFASLLAAGQAGAATTYTFVDNAIHDTRGGPNDDTIYFVEIPANQDIGVGDILNVTINFSGATNPAADRSELQFFINGEPSRFTCFSCFVFDVNWTVNGQTYPAQTISQGEADLSLPNVTTLEQIKIVATLIGVSDQSPSNVLSLNGLLLDAQILTAVPLPATLPLFVACLSLLGLVGWWRKPKRATA